MSDADEIRAVARQASTVAGEIRRAAWRISTADAVDWRSAGAIQYRKRLHEKAGRLNNLAREVDGMVGALHRYATAVEVGQSALTDAAMDAVGAFHDAAKGVGRAIAETSRPLTSGFGLRR